MTMTHAEAVKQASQLHKQGVAFSEITLHLAKAGYRSARTGRPATEMGIRYMVGAVKKKVRDEAKAAAAEDRPMMVGKASTTDLIKKLVDLSGVDEDIKLQLVEALINSRKGR